MQIPIVLDRNSETGLTVQIVEQLRESIRTGRIPAGRKLPSSRRLSEQLAVSRNTVVRAYEILEEESFVEARAASGIYATRDLPATAPAPAPATLMPMPPPAILRAPQLVNTGGGRLSFDFFPGRPSAGIFPLKAWRRLVHASLSRAGAAGLSQYSDPGGLFALRSAIAGHLAVSRGVVADPGQVIVVAGIQEGLSLAARLLIAPGGRALVENPCYQGATFAFEAAGAEIQRVPVDEAGLDTDALTERHACAIHATPSHQYPTGATLSLDRRARLVEWARRNGCYILEDDYDSDFRYEGSPLPAIAALAPDCTIYLGTFSKSLGAGLRVGYMVVPPALVDATRAAKAVLNNGNAWLEQAALAEFMRSGSFAAHLVRARARYRESRDAAIHALRRHFGEVEISGHEAGLHLLWMLPAGVPDAATLEALARKARIGIYSLASGGAFDGLGTAMTRRGIVLGYSSMTPRQIEQGIARLSDVIDDTLDRRPGFVDQLMVGEPMLLSRPQPAPRIRQKPALHAARPHRPYSPEAASAGGMLPMPVLRRICRYPIKGLSAEEVPNVVLAPDRPFPFDRVFALARPGVPVDRDDPKWGKKGLFCMLMLDEALARVRTATDEATSVLTVRDASGIVMTADLSNPAGRAGAEAFFGRLAPSLGGAPQLVRSRAGHFMDKPDNVVSLINLATVRSLEAQWGVRIDPLRLRANFYIDGIAPWREFEWVGSDIRIGDAILRVDRRNGRCSATNVNPATGERDLDIPGSLRAAFGHKDLGLYLTVRKGGRVAVGDPVAAPEPGEVTDMATPGPALTVPSPAAPAGRRFICRGCYFIYEEEKGHAPSGLAPGTPPAEFPDNWRCPDCGTDRAAFRPHLRGEADKPTPTGATARSAG